MSEHEAKVAVIGGGLSGLVAAFRLRQQLPSAKITLFEASGRCGGVIETVRHQDFLLEYGADSFSIKPPDILNLCEELGLSKRLIDPLPNNRRAMILYRGQMVPVPEGFALLRPTNLQAVMKSPLLSLRGRCRVLAEQFVRAKTNDEDESLESFAVRRFGREVFDRLLQPLVAGIYTAKASKLSMKATMPQFVEFEKKYGGMIKTTRALSEQGEDDASRSASGARYGQFRSFPNGMVELFDALMDGIGRDSIKLSTGIDSVERTGDEKWLLTTGGIGQRFDAVILSTNTTTAANLLKGTHPACARELQSIPYASSAIVLLGVTEDQVKHPLDCFGLVIPAVEQRKIIAASFAHRKFADRTPPGHHLIRVFIGGATQPDMLQHSNEELISIAIQEMRSIIGLTGQPALQRIQRWENAMPQYHVGHCETRNRIEEMIASLPNIELAGNGLHGVGIAHCVRTAGESARRLAASLS